MTNWNNVLVVLIMSLLWLQNSSYNYKYIILSKKLNIDQFFLNKSSAANIICSSRGGGENVIANIRTIFDINNFFMKNLLYELYNLTKCKLKHYFLLQFIFVLQEE